jgi:hypothetical protein
MKVKREHPMRSSGLTTCRWQGQLSALILPVLVLSTLGAAPPRDPWPMVDVPIQGRNIGLVRSVLRKYGHEGQATHNLDIIQSVRVVIPERLAEAGVDAGAMV